MLLAQLYQRLSRQCNLMKAFTYDLHIHSCLSPCGDDDMTVNNIAGMAFIKGLSLVALTDHNSCKNLPAFFSAAEQYGIIPVPGMELTTAEEIHLLCLFETLDEAMNFDKAIEPYRMKLKNRIDVFGNQYIIDENDNVIGQEEYFLPIATMLSLDQAVEMARAHGAACMPAHIDRTSNGILAILGAMPNEPYFGYVELKDRAKRDESGVGERHVLVNSDAHYLEDINEAENTIKLPVDDHADANEVRKALINLLRGEAK